MDVYGAVKGRRSIREFEEKDISGDALERLADALLSAPSAGNLQSRKFYFVTNPDMKKEIAGAALKQNFIASAPLVVVACADTRIERKYGERGVNLYSIQDAACSVMCMMLVAHELGLGSVWVGAFNEQEVANVLRIPASLRPVAIVPVGYPANVPQPTPKVTKEEAIVFV